jgi:hypothetical protein
MKSQDILLLFKLVSVAQQEHESHREEAAGNWLRVKDWEDWSDEDGDLPGTATKSDRDPYSVRSLSLATGISKSEVSKALNRCYNSGLAKPSRNTGSPAVNVKALGDFSIYGLRYVFPAELGSMTRGIVTGMTARIFPDTLFSAGVQSPVWPDAKGNTMGLAVIPLFKTVPYAARKDPRLYAFLALIDSLRLGLPRERNLAAETLDKLLKAGQ